MQEHRPSRSYIQPIPIVTTYEHEQADNGSINKRRSVAGSKRAPSVANQELYDNGRSVRSPSRAGEYDHSAPRAPSRAASTRSTAPPIVAPIVTPVIKNGTVRSASRASVRQNDQEQQHTRPASRAGSVRRNNDAHIGDVISHDRQRQMQQGQERPRVSLHDEPTHASSPRPMSPFGARPQPNLMTVTEDGAEGGRESRTGALTRNGTVNRASTLGRNGTMSRATNGGTIGTRRGAFGRGAGASIGTQPEEVLGRE